MAPANNVLLFSVQENLSTLGLKLIHYSLLDQGWNSHLIHLPHFKPKTDRFLEPLADFVHQLEPLFIGAGLMTTEYDRVHHLTTYFKARFPHIPVIWGGIHPTIAPETCFPWADYVCRGEGEQSVLDFAEAVFGRKDPGQIPNLCFIKDGGLVTNPLYPLKENLDEIPFCEHLAKNSYLQTNQGEILPVNRLLLKKYDRFQGRIYDILTTRGCPYSCTYCCNNVLVRINNSRRIRRRSIGNVMAELSRAVRDFPEIEAVNFGDDSFLSMPENHLEEFCAAYQREVGLPFIARSVPAAVTRRKLEILKANGMSWISIGLQTGSDRVAREVYHRKSTRRDFLGAARLVKEFDLAAIYDVILDNPYEEADDMLETVNTLLETPRPFFVNFFSLSLYFGTELYDRTLKERPDQMTDAYTKDYLKPEKTAYNDLIMMSPYLPVGLMRHLLRLHQAQPTGPRFRLARLSGRLLSALLFSPLAYLRVLRLAQGGSWTRTMISLSTYFKKIASRYIRQFNR
jgi:anaerobic magnesium-protoporphyrin IX monomethyl ester cyclase